MLSDEIYAGPPSSQPRSLVNNKSAIISKPPVGLTDEVIKEIADSLETDDQITSLAFALGQPWSQVNKCMETNRLSGSVTTKGTINLLMSWKTTVEPENQMSVMHSAMTKAQVILIRDTVLAKAQKRQEQEKQEYARKLRERQLETNVPSLETLRGADEPSSLHSVETNSSTVRPADTRSADSFHRRQQLYDIYLVYSEETEHVRWVKDIIRRNGWTMLTPSDTRLGVPKLTSVQEMLQTCSHVVLIITKDDCAGNDWRRALMIEMAFESSVGGIIDGRVISVWCCDEASLPLQLKCLTSISVWDKHLEERLKKSIDTSIKIRRKGSTKHGNCPAPPTDGAAEPEATVDAPSSVTAAQLSAQMQPLLHHLDQETVRGCPSLNSDPGLNSGPGPSYSLNIQGNVYNIGSLTFTPRHDDEVTSNPIVPLPVRHELSRLLNGPRFTHDDWTGLAGILGLDGYIDSLEQKPDPTLALLDVAIKEKKVQSLDDLKHVLGQMKRDDCVEVIDKFQYPEALRIKDADEESSDDEF